MIIYLSGNVGNGHLDGKSAPDIVIGDEANVMLSYRYVSRNHERERDGCGY